MHTIRVILRVTDPHVQDHDDWYETWNQNSEPHAYFVCVKCKKSLQEQNQLSRAKLECLTHVLDPVAEDQGVPQGNGE